MLKPPKLTRHEDVHAALVVRILVTTKEIPRPDHIRKWMQGIQLRAASLHLGELDA